VALSLRRQQKEAPHMVVNKSIAMCEDASNLDHRDNDISCLGIEACLYTSKLTKPVGPELSY